MIKQDIAQYAFEYGDCDYSKEDHELEQTKITLERTLKRLEDYYPNANTYAGSLLNTRWSSLINDVTELLNYVDHDTERNATTQDIVDQLAISNEWDAEHIDIESRAVRS